MDIKDMAREKIKKEYRVECEVVDKILGKVKRKYDFGSFYPNITKAREMARFEKKKYKGDKNFKYVFKIYLWHDENGISTKIGIADIL